MDVIKAVNPRIVFLENVPGLLSATVDDSAGRSIHYFGTILRDLAESGYAVKWKVLSAGEVGGSHRRDRLWIMAYTKSVYRDVVQIKQCAEKFKQGIKNLNHQSQVIERQFALRAEIIDKKIAELDAFEKNFAKAIGTNVEKMSKKNNKKR